MISNPAQLEFSRVLCSAQLPFFAQLRWVNLNTFSNQISSFQWHIRRVLNLFSVFGSIHNEIPEQAETAQQDLLDYVIPIFFDQLFLQKRCLLFMLLIQRACTGASAYKTNMKLFCPTYFSIISKAQILIFEVPQRYFTFIQRDSTISFTEQLPNILRKSLLKTIEMQQKILSPYSKRASLSQISKKAIKCIKSSSNSNASQRLTANDGDRMFVNTTGRAIGQGHRLVSLDSLSSRSYAGGSDE